MPKVDPVRDAAVQVLLRVFEHGAFLDLASDALLSKKQLSERGKRFFTQLVCGTVRHRLLVDHILQRLVTQPLEHLPRPILAILRMAAFQALFCNQVATGIDPHKRRARKKIWPFRHRTSRECCRTATTKVFGQCATPKSSE